MKVLWLIEKRPYVIYEWSPRNSVDGHWNLNCHQFGFKNYSLNVIPGYYHSTKEDCLVCDMVQGPFLARSALFQTFKFDEDITKSQLVGLDFFLRVIKVQIFSESHTQNFFKPFIALFVLFNIT